jgi:hypothetical protein
MATPEPQGCSVSASKEVRKSVCTEGAKTEVDMSVFDMLNVLRRRLLVTREELVKQVSMVSKDAEGLVDWVVLHPEFHSTLAKCALFLVFDGRPVSCNALCLSSFSKS